jgi:hypothetical protein
MVTLYGTPTVAPGRVGKIRERGASETVMLSGPLMVSTGLLESVALT